MFLDFLHDTDEVMGNERAKVLNEEVSLPDGDLEADDWNDKLIGNLAKHVLSRVLQAREKAGEVKAPSPAKFAQAVGGVAASKRNKDGHAALR
jgi:hypothetical protein